MSTSSTEHHLVDLTRQLLTAIDMGDWTGYRELVADDLSCFEPEARGQLVKSLKFHEFYFSLSSDRPTSPAQVETTLICPNVRILSEDSAVVTFVRLVQRVDGAGRPVTNCHEETRIWQRISGRWKHVHFHRSVPTS